MPEPVLAVEWNLGGSWLPVHPNPRRASYRRGRDRAQDKTSPGRCTLIFGNGDRHMDPEHNAYFGLLRPGTLVRLKATWAGVAYDLFTGYLETMVQHFGNPRTPHDAIMTWTLVDGLSVLANAGLPSAWEIHNRDAGARTWYRFNEARGPYLFDNVGSAHGTYAGTGIEYGISSTGALEYPPDENDTMVRFPAGSYTVVPAAALPHTLNDWSMTFLYSLESWPTAAQNLMYQATYPYGIQIIHDDNGRIGVYQRGSTGALLASVRTDFGQYGDGVLTTIVGKSGQPLKVYAGDVDLSANQTGTSQSIPNTWAVMNLSNTQEYVMDEVLFWDKALTQAELTTLLEAYAGWNNPLTQTGEAVATRIGRILDAAGWSATLRDVTTEAPGTLKPHVADSALAILQRIESTIEGRLWIDPSGVLRIESLRELARAPYTDVQASFTDDGAGNPYVGIGPYELGWELLTNVIRRTNGDFIISARDEASITAYGLRDMTDVADVESMYYTLDYESDLANYRLVHYKDPVRHVNGIKVLPSGEPDTLYPIVLGLDLGERIAFTRTPQGIGAPLSHEAIVEGIKVDISPKKWEWDYSIDAVYALEFFRFDSTLWDAPDWRFTA